MPCPSPKSLLVYCCLILLLNRKIITTANIRRRTSTTVLYEENKWTGLRSSPPLTIKSMAASLKSVNSSPIVVGSKCKARDGDPGMCFPPETCLEWEAEVTDSRRFGDHETRWPVCEWLYEPTLTHRRHPRVLVAQQQRPLTVCCRDPQLLVGKSPMRQISRSFVEIPERKAHRDQNQGHGQCGISFPSTDSHFHPLSKRRRRMVSGHSTTAHDHPWMAVLFVDGQFRCGAAILNHRVVITTAHCLLTNDNKIHVYEVMVGSSDLGSGTMHQVVKVVRHPAFRRKSVMNDVALLITVKSIVFSDDVNPICFPSLSMDTKAVQGLMATMTGFGTFYYGKRHRRFSCPQLQEPGSGVR